jgi:hypothetical protein
MDSRPVKSMANFNVTVSDEQNAKRVITRTLIRNRTLANPKWRWEDNIKVNRRKKGFGSRRWIELA